MSWAWKSAIRAARGHVTIGFLRLLVLMSVVGGHSPLLVLFLTERSHLRFDLCQYTTNAPDGKLLVWPHRHSLCLFSNIEFDILHRTQMHQSPLISVSNGMLLRMQKKPSSIGSANKGYHLDPFRMDANDGL